MSLRARAVLIAGFAVVVLWALAAAGTIRGVQGHLDRTLDDRLAMSARMVSGLIQRSGLTVSSPMASSELGEAVRVGGGEGMACQIRSLRGEVLAQTAGTPDTVFSDQAMGYGLADIAGESWRTFTLRDGDYQIVTADRINERAILARQMLITTSVPFLIAVVGGLLALWVGIGRGLAPLDTLSQTLSEKTVDDTSPVDIGHPPAELVPVVGAMNELLGRLAMSLSAQRAFTDAAAHELRTPLTAIDTHLQVARLTEGAASEASLEKAAEGVRRLSRILNQMMTLARTDVDTDASVATGSIRTTVESLVERLPPVERQRVVLDTGGGDGGSPLPGTLLEAAVRNLMDNALHYSPPDSPVSIRLLCDSQTGRGLIEVADRGAGLSEEEIARVGRRFWRGDQGRNGREGAGLGISIVRSISDRFGGTFSLHPREGGGLVARLTIPLE